MLFRGKLYSIVFSLIAIIICSVNLMGMDSKGIILFYTTPPLWLTKLEVFQEQFGNLEDMPVIVKYALSVTFWGIVGEKMDKRRQVMDDDF